MVLENSPALCDLELGRNMLFTGVSDEPFITVCCPGIRGSCQSYFHGLASVPCFHC